MRLLVVSHTPHHVEERRILGWGPTVRELDRLATLFTEVRHVAPVHPGPAPAAFRPYRSPEIRLVPVAPAGGTRLRDRLGVLRRLPRWWRAITAELPAAEMLHVRCPAAISALALVAIRRHGGPGRRWFKYAGNWRPSGREPFSYRLQRRWLRAGRPAGTVTVNGRWPGEPRHVHAFRNPCLSEEELRGARTATGPRRLDAPPRLLFAGRLDVEKGALRAVEILERLRGRGVDARLDLAGDGPARDAIARRVDGAAASRITMHGWVPRERLDELYGAAHFLLLPSTASEGWPKVLAEAMARGAVPLAGEVSAIAAELAECACGRALPPLDVDAFVREIESYLHTPERWERESTAGRTAAERFTYESWLLEVCELFDLPGTESTAAIAASVARSTTP